MATPHDAFVHRHIGPDPAGTAEILDFLGYDSPAELAAAALPADIAQTEPTQLPDALDEAGALAALRARIRATRQSRTGGGGVAEISKLTR